MNAIVAKPAASRRCRAEFDEVKRRVESLGELAGLPQAQLFRRVERVSAWSVADHVGHLARSNAVMAEAVRKIITPGFSGEAAGLTLVGRVVLFTGWIPRGAGRAPESTRPQVESAEALRREVDESNRAVLELEVALPEVESAKGRIGHFAFGGLTARQWVRVMAIHMHHHLKIIAAIQRSQNASQRTR